MPLGTTSSFSRSFRAGERPALSQAQIAATASVWYDAASPSYYQPQNPSNGTSLNNWNDRSAVAHNAAPQGGSNKPTYVTPGLNGYGVVNFASTQNLQIPAGNPNWMASKSTFGQYVVAKLNTNTSGTRTLTESDTAGFKIQYSGGVWTASTAGGIGTTSITADTGWHIFALLFDGNQTGNANRLKFRYDKTNYTLNFGATTVGTTTNANTKTINIAYDGSTNYWLGQIAEILFFTFQQDSTQIDLVEQYLENKWAI